MKVDEQNLQNQILAEALKKEALRKILTKDAMERLSRVRLVNPALALQVENYLFQLYQMGQIKQVINDETLKKILSQLTTKKSGKIKVIRK